jgi:uncharacterized protein YqeY
MLREELAKKLKEAMKAQNILAKDVLRVILGEADTEEGRGKPATDESIQRIVRKMADSNRETRALCKQGTAAADKLDEEYAYLDLLLPKSLGIEDIKKALDSVVADLKLAKSDGQATGLAMKTLKELKLTVLGNDVALAVKQLRSS